MDSGGGIVKALPLLGAEPFYLLNADTFWLEDPDQPANLASLARDWNGARMDLLLMTVTLDRFIGHNGKLDFNRDNAGRLTRFDAGAPNAVVYPGVAIVDPQIFHGRAAEPFSLNLCFDQAIAGKRLFASAAHGLWLTVGTPQAISEAETAMDGADMETALSRNLCAMENWLRVFVTAMMILSGCREQPSMCRRAAPRGRCARSLSIC